MSRPRSAQEALDALREGNLNFVQNTPAHPRQDAELRRSLAENQAPFAALFGCSDSRLGAEMIFDVGLGDLFVVRNAGQVIAETIIGSLEFAVASLEVPLILVLGHDSCGAIKAAVAEYRGTENNHSPYIQKLTNRIQPTVADAFSQGIEDPDLITRSHISDTVAELMAKSELIASRVNSGELAVVGAHYELAEGKVQVISVVGKVQ